MPPAKVRVFYPDYDAEHERVLKAFAQGTPQAQAIPIWSYSPPQKVDKFHVAVVYGDYKKAVPRTKTKRRVIQGQDQTKRDLVFVDSGYIKRDEYYSVGLGAMLGKSRPYFDNSPPNRWQALGVTRTPMQHRPDGKIILAGQVPWDSNVQYDDHIRWLNKAYSRLVDLFDQERVIFRPHPRVVDLHYDIPSRYWSTQGTLEDLLATAGGLVTFNSNSAVDALLAGVPYVTLGPGSIAKPCSLGSMSDLAVWLSGDLPGYAEKPFDQLCHNIAYAQWTEQEMSTGQMWAAIKDHLVINDDWD